MEDQPKSAEPNDLADIKFDLYQADSSSGGKLWGISLDDNKVHVVYGPKNARRLNFYSKTFNSASEASGYGLKKSGEKSKKGYSYIKSNVTYKQSDLNFKA